MSKLTIVGIGPGNRDNMTIAADKALQAADVIIGYTVYADLVRDDYPGKEFITTPMTKEIERCRIALELAGQGKNVVLICSGDSGIYGMAGPAYELRGNSSEPERRMFRRSIFASSNVWSWQPKRISPSFYTTRQAKAVPITCGKPVTFCSEFFPKPAPAASPVPSDAMGKAFRSSRSKS